MMQIQNVWNFRFWSFEIISDFVLRISCLGSLDPRVKPEDDKYGHFVIHDSIVTLYGQKTANTLGSVRSSKYCTTKLKEPVWASADA